MRIVDIRERTVTLEGAISNAVVSFAGHTVSLVALVSDRIRNGRPVVGYGFDSIGRFGQAGIIGERMRPRILAADPESLLDRKGRFEPGAVLAAAMAGEKPGGHGDRAAAAGALELAVWDLEAKLADEPAYRTIARRFGRVEEHCAVEVYAAGGYYYPDEGPARLASELEGYRALGFHAFKIKVGGAALDADLARIEGALQVAGSGDRLAVDANGRFDVEAALRFASAITPYGLRWFEEPGDPLDYELNRTVAESFDGRIATGENLFSAIDALNLVRYGGMRPQRDVFQMDPGLSYGLTGYARMLDVLAGHGHERSQCHPHGGHLINLHVVAGLGLGGCVAYPGVFRPFGGYSPDCSIEGGRVRPGEAPGFGLECKPELAPLLVELAG
jgi:L-alanine-DL-glutamate epimerase-like enolase superfamily enzyme